jgi:hypothetical protein
MEKGNGKRDDFRLAEIPVEEAAAQYEGRYVGRTSGDLLLAESWRNVPTGVYPKCTPLTTQNPLTLVFC